LTKFYSELRLQVIPKNNYLFTQGTVGLYAYIVLRGKAIIFEEPDIDLSQINENPKSIKGQLLKQIGLKLK